MRKFSTLGLSIFLVIIVSVRGQQSKQLSDQKIQRELTGTWVGAWGRNLTITNVIAADGSYVTETIGFTNGLTGRYHGMFLAKDGIVVNKAEFGKQTVVAHLHIIRLDSHELVWSNDAAVTLPIFHKVGK